MRFEERPVGDAAVLARGRRAWWPGPRAARSRPGRLAHGWAAEISPADVAWSDPARRVTEEPDEEVTLIPYGCTNIRITEFPRLKPRDGLALRLHIVEPMPLRYDGRDRAFGGSVSRSGAGGRCDRRRVRRSDPPIRRRPPPQLTLTCPPAQTAVSLRGPAGRRDVAGADGARAARRPSRRPARRRPARRSRSARRRSAAPPRAAAASQTASCSFTVTVTRPPQLVRDEVHGVRRQHHLRHEVRSGRVPRVPAARRPSYSYPSQLQVIARRALHGPDHHDGQRGLARRDASTRAWSGCRRRSPTSSPGRRPPAPRRQRPAEQSEQRDDPVHRRASCATWSRVARRACAANRVLLATFPPQFVGTPPQPRRRLGVRARTEPAHRGGGAERRRDAGRPLRADVGRREARTSASTACIPTEQGFTLMAADVRHGHPGEVRGQDRPRADAARGDIMAINEDWRPDKRRRRLRHERGGQGDCPDGPRQRPRGLRDSTRAIAASSRAATGSGRSAGRMSAASSSAAAR